MTQGPETIQAFAVAGCCPQSVHPDADRPVTKPPVTPHEASAGSAPTYPVTSVLAGLTVMSMCAHIVTTQREQRASGGHVATAVVAGVGPGLGTSTARRFAREGFSLTVISRRRSTVRRSPGGSRRIACRSCRWRRTPPKNPPSARGAQPSWSPAACRSRSRATSACHSARPVSARSWPPWTHATGPAGVHVGTVTVHGPIAPGSAFDPDDIAEHYWRLHSEELGSWRL